MSVSITDNSLQVKSEADNKVNLAIRLMLEDIHRIANPNTPKDHGNLRADVIKELEKHTGTITWTKKYASVQERGVIRGTRISNYSTPGTGPHYAENAVRRVVRNYRAYFRRVGL